MKKRKVLLFIMGAFMLLFAGNASATTIADIGDGTLQIGDKIFSDFLVSGIDANAVNVWGEVEPSGIVDIVFQASFQVTNPLTATAPLDKDFFIKYIVTAMGGQFITSIDQAFNLTAQGTGGSVGIGETVFNRDGALVAQSSVGFLFGVQDANDPPGEVAQGDNLIISLNDIPTPMVSVSVTKDISVTANPGGMVGATWVEQSFHQTAVPEPATMLLLGLGLVGLAGVSRKCKK